MNRKALLHCGILSSVLYFLMDTFVPLGFEGYDRLSMTVSEIAAIDAPTRKVWVVLAFIYTLLVGAFSIGVRQSSFDNRPLRITSMLMVAYTVANLIWPFFPMHLREALAAGEKSMSDTMHLVMAGISVLLMVSAMGFSAFAFGNKFKVYSLASIATQLCFGILTSFEAPGVETNSPTPWIGLWERINILVFLVWVVVLGTLLLGERLKAKG